MEFRSKYFDKVTFPASLSSLDATSPGEWEPLARGRAVKSPNNPVRRRGPSFSFASPLLTAARRFTIPIPRSPDRRRALSGSGSLGGVSAACGQLLSGTMTAALLFRGGAIGVRPAPGSARGFLRNLYQRVRRWVFILLLPPPSCRLLLTAARETLFEDKPERVARQLGSFS